MRSLFIVGLLSSLLPLSSVYASAVRGCEIDAKVLAIKDDKGEITLSLEVVTAKPTGHSAGVAICDDAGTKLEFPVDNDAEVIAAKVAVGDTVRVEDVMIYNFDAKGNPISFHNQDYISTLSSAAASSGASPSKPLASAAVGCEVTAKVLSMKRETKIGKDEVTYSLQVMKAEKIGGGVCPKKRSKLTFAPENDQLAIDAQANEKDTIKIKLLSENGKATRHEFVSLVSKEKGDGVVPK